MIKMASNPANFEAVNLPPTPPKWAGHASMALPNASRHPAEPARGICICDLNP